MVYKSHGYCTSERKREREEREKERQKERQGG